MIPFLKQVAAHYYATDIHQTCFVFPNRRSMAFFRKYLGEILRESGADRPLIVPDLYTVNDFFYRAYDVDVTDRIRLVLELYACYKAVYPKAEPLDEFVFWGDIILSDFDDVDKYMADARNLFTNVADFKGIQDDYSHLTPVQEKAIAQFVSHFRDHAGRLTVHIEADDPGVKGRFLQVWNILFPLYELYRKHLEEKGMAYEGMVYRSLAEALRGGRPVRDVLEGRFPHTSRFVFVGLNALNTCEKLVLGKMRDAALAEFCWDYSSDWIRDPQNKSSFFLQDQVRSFPPAFTPDPEGLPLPVFHVVSVPSSVGQAKLAPSILAGCEGDPVETAFVLPDEKLLMPLLNAIPPEYASINVTMGYPMTGGAVYSLMSDIASLQMHLRKRPDGWYFYHRQVYSVFSSSLLRAVLTPEEEAVIDRVKTEAKYYIPETDLRGGPFLDLVFRVLVTDPKGTDPAVNRAVADAFVEILSYLGWKLRGMEEMILELDFAKRYLMALHTLREMEVAVQPGTWLRLLDQLLSGISVPFQGEPLEGLQVMGPLETRALDFRNLVILSANEGTFPRRSVSASFIPPELRKGFSLPTYEYQDSIWAYYFYRMIQRAEKVWLVYDSRTEGLKTGEESRYIKQLEYHFRARLDRMVAVSSLRPAYGADEIPKTAADIAEIRRNPLSASVLQSYLFCPAKFYYQAVRHLKVEEDVAESLDAGMIGDVFHKTMQTLYDGKGILTPDDLRRMGKDTRRIKTLVRKLILEQMHSIEVSGRNLVVEEVIVQYVRQTLRHDLDLLSRSGSGGFRILGLERRMTGEFAGFRFKGFVDRIDSYRDGEIRIVDYKTGRVEDEDINITDDNAAAVVEKLFGPSNQGRPKIALQLFLYDMFAGASPDLSGGTIVNSVYSVSRLFTAPLEDRVQSREFARLAGERLREMLAELVDPAVPFRRTEDEHTCSYCDFKMICGR